MSRSVTSRRSVDAAGRMTYELSEAGPRWVGRIIDALEREFGFTKTRPPLVGFDEFETTLTRGASSVTVGWDNVNGCYVCSDDRDAMSSISTYLDKLRSR